MSRFSRSLAPVLVALAAVGLPACGGSGATNVVGVGTISLTSIAPSPLLGCAPQPFTITGSGFETVTGTTVRVTFTATGGATPFGGSATTVVLGDVISDTTITGTTPEFEICGGPSITFDIDVTLESGVSASASGSSLSVTVNPPTVTAISANPIPAAIPTLFSLTGTGFGAVGSPVTIRFTSANPGDLNFADGTANFVDVQTTVASSTTTTATDSPIARACTANFTASVQVLFPDGCCSVPTANTFVAFLAPTITTGPTTITAAAATASSLTGANFGVPGEIGIVRFSSTSPIFGGNNTVDVPGTVGVGSTSVTFTTPLAAVCQTASESTTLRWFAPRGGSCAQQAAIASFTRPTIASVNVPLVNALDGAIETVTGAGFPTSTLTPITVRFTSNFLNNPIFADGTSSSIDVEGFIVNATTITVTAPIATWCIAGFDTFDADIQIFFPGGSCAVGNDLITYQSPALETASPGGIRNTHAPTSLFPDNNVFSFAGGDPFEITALPGRSFGSVGAVVDVRFTTTAAVFQGGAQNYDTVLGLVTSATTITGVSPATIAQLGTIGPSSFTATAEARFEDGSCSGSTACVFAGTMDRTFVIGDGGVFTVDQNGAGAPALVAGGPVVGALDVAVDARKNRMVTLDTLVYDTAPTTLATPAQPEAFSSGYTIPANNVVIVPDLNRIWFTRPGDGLVAMDENSASALEAVASLLFTPTPAPGTEILANHASGELVVAFLSTSQIGVYDANNGDLVSLYLIPSTDANNGGAPEFWNGVMTIRPTASGDARAYTVHDEPGGSPDALGTLELSTGFFTATPTDPLATTPGLGIPSALAFDTSRDQVVWWRGDTALGGVVERVDPVSLLITFSAALPGNVVSISTDTVSTGGVDRYYLSNLGTTTLDAFDAVGGAIVGSVAVPATGSNASTAP